MYLLGQNYFIFIIFFEIWLYTTMAALNSPNECRIDVSLQGTFQRQFSTTSNGLKQTPLLEKVTITSSSVNIWGECYENVGGNSYVFGMKRIGRSICYRCVTLVLKTSNVIQSLHQDEEICHDSVEDARRSCFDMWAVSPGDGKLLFRSEHYDSRSCGLEGRFDFTYQMKGMGKQCITNSSEMDNCGARSEMNFRFKQCNFPDFEQTFVCMGTWNGAGQEKYIVVLNEEIREYKCGIIISKGEYKELFFSVDSSCDRLQPSGNNALEVYRFREKNSDENFSACRFPEWIQGEYEGMSIKDGKLVHKNAFGNTPSITSRCVETDHERVLVHSQTTCENELGFHCIWFRSRSNSVVEFKTTSSSSEGTSQCRDENEFESASWTTLISNNPQREQCGILGHYMTPKPLQIYDCHNLTTVDCQTKNQFKLVAYHCETGVVYDAKTYTCYGTWKEGVHLFVYTKNEDNSPKANVCFISREYDGKLFIAPLGSHCDREFNFTENPDKTVILQQQDSCSLEQERKEPPTQTVPLAPKIIKHGKKMHSASTDVISYTDSEDDRTSGNDRNVALLSMIIFVSIFYWN